MFNFTLYWIEWQRETTYLRVTGAAQNTVTHITTKSVQENCHTVSCNAHWSCMYASFHPLHYWGTSSTLSTAIVTLINTTVQEKNTVKNMWMKQSWRTLITKKCQPFFKGQFQQRNRTRCSPTTELEAMMMEQGLTITHDFRVRCPTDLFACFKDHCYSSYYTHLNLRGKWTTASQKGLQF